MLLFVDQPKNIKILRLQEKDEGVQRIRVGTVQKNKLELNEELTNGLTTARARRGQERHRALRRERCSPAQDRHRPVSLKPSALWSITS